MSIAVGDQSEPRVVGGWRAAGVVVTLVVVAGYSFLRALEDQLGRLGSPGAHPAYRAFSHLHGPRPEIALRTWDGGTETLAGFTPVTPQTLIRVHAVVALVVVVAAAATLVVVTEILRRHATRHRPGVTITGALALAALTAVLAQLAESLAEAALANAVATGRTRPRDDPDRYASLFDTTASLKAGGLGVATALLVLIALRTGAVRRGWRALVEAPASHKTTLLAMTVFAAMVADGDLGAQAEDLLRREIAQGGPVPWLLLFGTLGLMLYLLDALRGLDPPPDASAPDRTPVAPGWVLLGGAATTVVGLVTLLAAGGAALLVAGVVVLVYGSVVAVAHRRRTPGGGEPLADAGLEARLETVLGRQLPDRAKARSAMLSLAAALPTAGLAVLTGRLLAGEMATQRGWVLLAVLETVLLLVAGVAVLVLSREVRRQKRSALPGGVVAGVVVAAVVAIAAASWSDPSWGSDLGERAGTIAVLLFGLAAVPAVGLLLRIPSRRLGRPASVRPAARTPVVGLGALWFLLAVTVGGAIEDPDLSPHLARTLERPTDVPAGDCGGLDSEQADAVADVLRPGIHDPDEGPGAAVARGRLCRWIVRNAGPDAPGTARDEGRTVPLLLVAASGGGVRAATWTATALECLLLRGEDAPQRCGAAGPGKGPHRDAWPLLFAAGGASGGSVGVASATAQRIAPVEDEWTGDDEDWLRRLATRDHVAAVAARMALVETPAAWTGWQPAVDRAEVLIDSWSEQFGPVRDDACDPEGEGEDAAEGTGDHVVGHELEEVGFITLAHDCPDQVPALLLNGTVVGSGQRFDGSPLGAFRAPGQTLGPTGRRSDDPIALRDALCSDRDVPFFDLTFASARFPLVTPSARFPGEPRNACDDGRIPAVDVVDGGYRENSGAIQVLDLVRAIRPALRRYAHDIPEGFRPVVPLLVEIENGEGTGAADGAREGPAGSLAAAVAPEASPRDTDDAARTWLAEPARVPLTAWNVRARGNPDTEARQALRRAVRTIEGGSIVRLALARHPGRALPLGWSLTDAIVDDMGVVMRLCPNQLALHAVWTMIDSSSPRPGACRPSGRRPEAGPWL